MMHQSIENGIDGEKAGGNRVCSVSLLFGLRVGLSPKMLTVADTKQSSPPQRDLAQHGPRIPSAIARTAKSYA